MNHKDFGILFYLHLVIILMIYTSPFYIPWPVILFFIFLYYIQITYVGNCVISRLEFKEKIRNTTFYSHYLQKLGFPVNKDKLRMFLDYVMPWVILSIALMYQL